MRTNFLFFPLHPQCLEIRIDLKPKFDQGAKRVQFWSDSLGVSGNRGIRGSALHGLVASERSLPSAVLWAGPLGACSRQLHPHR